MPAAHRLRAANALDHADAGCGGATHGQSRTGADADDRARLLEQAMTNAGFVPYYGEWWHYSDSVQYDVVN